MADLLNASTIQTLELYEETDGHSNNTLSTFSLPFFPPSYFCLMRTCLLGIFMIASHSYPGSALLVFKKAALQRVFYHGKVQA